MPAQFCTDCGQPIALHEHEFVGDPMDFSHHPSACLPRLRVLLAQATVARTPGVGFGDFSIGSDVWPGASKLLEEMGELTQVLGKLIATHGRTDHWSGDLRAMLVDEMADVLAAISFFRSHNLTADEMMQMSERCAAKRELFEGWHRDPRMPGEGER